MSTSAAGAGDGALIIRDFTKRDAGALVEILKTNGQFAFPEIDGPEAMERVARCGAAVFLVAETGGRVAGMIRAVYDGSRAIINQLSVDPALQGAGTGRRLVECACVELRGRGAPTVSVTVTDTSCDYWVKLGFREMGVRLMLKDCGGAGGREGAC